MKNKYLILLMTWLFVLATVGATICAGDQAVKYLSNQDRKQVFLAEVKEDVAVLTSCLQSNYRYSGVTPEFRIPSEDVSKFVPSSQSDGPGRKDI